MNQAKYIILVLMAIMTGIVVCPFLCVGVGLLAMVNSFMNFWAGLVVGLREAGREPAPEQPEAPKSIWDKHLERLDANKTPQNKE